MSEKLWGRILDRLSDLLDTHIEPVEEGFKMCREPPPVMLRDEVVFHIFQRYEAFFGEIIELLSRKAISQLSRRKAAKLTFSLEPCKEDEFIAYVRKNGDEKIIVIELATNKTNK